MSTPLQPCPCVVSTIFVYATQPEQTAANSVYLSKKGDVTSSIVGTSPVNHSVRLTFKTDFERMQYLLGLYGRDSQGLR